jgi:hypothetical protein
MNLPLVLHSSHAEQYMDLFWELEGRQPVAAPAGQEQPEQRRGPPLLQLLQQTGPAGHHNAPQGQLYHPGPAGAAASSVRQDLLHIRPPPALRDLGLLCAAGAADGSAGGSASFEGAAAGLVLGSNRRLTADSGMVQAVAQALSASLRHGGAQPPAGPRLPQQAAWQPAGPQGGAAAGATAGLPALLGGAPQARGPGAAATGAAGTAAAAAASAAPLPACWHALPAHGLAAAAQQQQGGPAAWAVVAASICGAAAGQLPAFADAAAGAEDAARMARLLASLSQASSSAELLDKIVAIAAAVTAAAPAAAALPQLQWAAALPSQAATFLLPAASVAPVPAQLSQGLDERRPSAPRAEAKRGPTGNEQLQPPPSKRVKWQLQDGQQGQQGSATTASGTRGVAALAAAAPAGSAGSQQQAHRAATPEPAAANSTELLRPCTGAARHPKLQLKQQRKQESGSRGTSTPQSSSGCS